MNTLKALLDSGMFKLGSSDVVKALAMAVISGAVFPIIAAVQTPNFSITNVNWDGVLVLAINGAIIGGVSYLVKNFFSTNNGAVLGAFGAPKTPTV